MVVVKEYLIGRLVPLQSEDSGATIEIGSKTLVNSGASLGTDEVVVTYGVKEPYECFLPATIIVHTIVAPTASSSASPSTTRTRSPTVSPTNPPFPEIALTSEILSKQRIEVNDATAEEGFELELLAKRGISDSNLKHLELF